MNVKGKIVRGAMVLTFQDKQKHDDVIIWATM